MSIDVSDTTPVNKQPKKQPSLPGRLLRNNNRSPSPELDQSLTPESLPPLADLQLSGYAPGTKHRVLDEDLALNIRNLLPPRLQLYNEWELLYSLEQHGISLNSLYRNCRPETQRKKLRKKKENSHSDQTGYAEGVIKNMVAFGDPSRNKGSRPHGYVLVVQDEHKNKFGCYMSEHPHPLEHKRYYGNGECFLWKCEWYHAEELGKRRRERRFKAFPYTGLNDNLVYSNVDFIAVGSSHGQNGLYIDKSLYSGVSYPCETFGNEILCEHVPGEKYGSFKIINLEVWRVGELDDD